jgi:hypothetical protein
LPSLVNLICPAPPTSLKNHSIFLHFDGSSGSEIGLEDFLESFGGIDVDTKGLLLSDDVSISIDVLEGTHYKILIN